MIEYERFGFAAPPGTPVEWFTDLCRRAGLTTAWEGHAYTPPGGRFGGVWVSLVSDPLTWLRDFHAATKGSPSSVGAEAVDRLIALRAGRDLPSFVATYLDEAPGAIGRVFASYPAVSVLRTEDLPWAAVEFLDMVGVDLRRHQDGPLFFDCEPCRLEKHLTLRVMEAERDFCEAFDYQ